MKTSKKLLVCLILIVAGLAIGGVGRLLGGTFYSLNWNGNGLNVSSIDEMISNNWSASDNSVAATQGTVADKLTFQSFEDIDVYTSFGEVELIESDYYGVEYRLPDNLNVTVEVKNNVLHVNAEGNNSKVSFGNGFSGKTYIYVYYPQDQKLGDINIDDSFGSITLNDLNCKSIKTYASFGSIDGKDIKADDIAMEASSGSVGIKNITAKTVYFDNSFGSIDLGQVDASERFEAYLSSGSVDIKKLDSKDATIEDSFGEVTVGWDDQANTNFDLETSFGSVEVYGASCKDSYSKNVGGEKKLTISCSSGSIEVK